MKAVCFAVMLGMGCGDTAAAPQDAAVDAHGLDAEGFDAEGFDAEGFDAFEPLMDAADTHDALTQDDAGQARGRPIPSCNPATPTPSGNILWPRVLSEHGIDTLAGHAHDDGRGAVAACGEERRPEQPYYRLLAVGFESDQDLNGDGDDGDGLPIDFFRDSESFTGVGESGGRHHIYVDVLDEAGIPLSSSTAPALRLLVTEGENERQVALDMKPANEFQTNIPMAGGVSYAVEVVGQSDRISNMRMPNNHHVTYLLVFQRQP